MLNVINAGPVWTHDCTCCTYLGSFEGLDLYVCGREYISRWSSEGPDYRSVSLDILNQFGRRAGEDLFEARERHLTMMRWGLVEALD